MMARNAPVGRRTGWLLVLAVALAAGDCSEPVVERTDPGALPATLDGGPWPAGPLAVTHGGVGSPPEWAADCQSAADWAEIALEQGMTALDASVAGTMVMENNPKFNAGTGANIRLDGRTIQMDAAVMTSDGDYAAVAAIERVRNPVAVARAVLATPHRLLVGEGATRFAHLIGFPDETPLCPEAEAKYRRRITQFLSGQAEGATGDFDWLRNWNYPGDRPAWARIPQQSGGPESQESFDTVGTVVRDADGHFAASLSTGGTSITLYGRVGDVPIYGCGCYAGPVGAVACTGFGEEIIRRAMARTVYGYLEQGLGCREAVRQGCARFPNEYSLGLIAVDPEGWAVAANREMAYGMSALKSEGQ